MGTGITSVYLRIARTATPNPIARFTSRIDLPICANPNISRKCLEFLLLAFPRPIVDQIELNIAIAAELI
jgi:hypothetical protein